MSVKLENPVYKTEVVKVSNMDAVASLNDDSLFLVIQDGFAHKISAKTLRESIYQFAQAQFDDFFKTAILKQREQKKEFQNLSADCIAAADSLDKSLNRKFLVKNKENRQYIDDAIASLSVSFDDWKVEALSSVIDSTAVVKSMFDAFQNDTNNYLADYDQKISVQIEDLENSSNDKMLSLSADVEKIIEDSQDILSKTLESKIKTLLSANVYNLQNSIENVKSRFLANVESLSTALADRCSQFQKSIDSQYSKIQQNFQNTQDLSSQITQHCDSISAMMLTDQDIQSKQLSTDLSVDKLSVSLADLDKKLYGLTVEEVDENFKVVEHVVLNGDISQLSSNVQVLNSKYDMLLSAITELKEKIQ